jgi:hypothetical protein
VGPAASERRIANARERLQQSRAELFMLAHQIKGDSPRHDGDDGDDGGDGFPRSRLMRALTGPRGRMLLGGVALVATVLRPALLARAGKFARLLRPLLFRYLLPRLLR